jgi:hypothetical protein
VTFVLTISKLKRGRSTTTSTPPRRPARREGSGARRRRLGEYYSERETRTPIWLLAGDAHTVAELVGLTDGQRAGGDADAELVHGGSTTGPPPTVRMGAHSVSAVCMASI